MRSLHSNKTTDSRLKKNEMQFLVKFVSKSSLGVSWCGVCVCLVTGHKLAEYEFRHAMGSPRRVTEQAAMVNKAHALGQCVGHAATPRYCCIL